MIPLAIEHLTKRYGGRPAVDDLSLSIPTGTVFGLIGRNGAGKSTTIACALGLLRFNSGTVRFFGEVPTARSFDRIAYVPEINVLDAWMTTAQHITFRRSVFSRFDGAAMNELMERFEIDPSRSLKKLSKGQRQAVALALAFAQRAELLVLDEPASGLDPVLQRRLLDTIVSSAADGTTILFSSHQIGHVEQAAERIGILEKSRLVLEADVENLRERRALIEAAYREVPDLGKLRAAIVSPMEIEGAVVRVYADGDASEVESILNAHGPLSLAKRPMTLEQIFFDAIELNKEQSA